MQKHLERKAQEGEEMRFVKIKQQLNKQTEISNSYFFFRIFFLCRKLVEQTMMEHENTKEARRKLQEYKQKLGEKLCKNGLINVKLPIV